jgi:N-glycosylase/DNA lyase
MNEEMNWEEYEKILMQRPGFREALKETLPEYEIARKKIKARIRRLQFKQKINEMKKAVKDERFMEDLKEVSKDFEIVDAEGW